VRKPSGQICNTLMRLLIPFILLTILMSCNRTEFSDKKNTRDEPLTNYPYTYIDTESRFTDSTGLDVIIQNSLPKGVGHTTGKNFDRILWTRIINQAATPFELTVNFPADSFPISSSPGAYIKVFLPIDTMTHDKEELYAYGVTSGLTKPTPLQKTIHPKEEALFYIGVLFCRVGGVVRGELVLRGQNLFYTIRGIPQKPDSTLIPCGQIVFKN
jgi:hypothetical protein